MFNPDLKALLKDKTSRYSLVVATAKRAREITESVNQNGDILEEKTVSMAIEELIDGKFKVVEPEEIRNL